MAALTSGLIAFKVATAALRPLHHAAQIIGSIDERSLDRRIDSSRLPPELAPVATTLNAMLARLEDATQRRRQFLADASHELRTPVAALATTLEVALRRPREAAEYRRSLETCLTDARLLRQLVEALMTQARSELAVRDEPLEKVQLQPLLDQCAEVAVGLAQGKQVQVKVQGGPALHVLTQTARLRSILLNLLSNAVEYNNPGGEVMLCARQRTSEGPDDLGAGELVIEVQDTGPGIAPEHLPRLFEPFYRIDRARESSGHLGLGLFLVQAHVKALGGECAVRSKLGEGTVFEVRLPGAIVQQPEEAKTHRKDSESKKVQVQHC
jgi:two-component system OmpR family sensor kinase